MNNVAIIGPGAVGSTIAFDLRDASLNVQLLGRAMKRFGIIQTMIFTLRIN
ncbi:2-dehydropantoate 2-reductase N-terminal domain-containing protein [Staphylococcus sp. GDX8P47P]|uniref:2-dehydropantoate 2-reductase N-terminal domain-containing protein n=1 Tax=Staphylococcus sp. GDX8P47P TaxID=2804098 RepID=UPI0027D20EA5|nr:2-dehydropantoate 2-reductase N-terminal domain-containing protein [Staphylococcus sp. GDX8P47P]